MKIEVEFSPAFQARLSLQHQTFILEEGRSTLRDLLDRLAEEHGEKIRPLLFSPPGDTVLSGLMVQVNDRLLTGNTLDPGEIRLGEGDRVSLLYFMSGG